MLGGDSLNETEKVGAPLDPEKRVYLLVVSRESRC